MIPSTIHYFCAFSPIRVSLCESQTSTAPLCFQVIIEGIWGNPRASGYIAVDDVTFYDGECEAVPATANVVKVKFPKISQKFSLKKMNF